MSSSSCGVTHLLCVAWTRLAERDGPDWWLRCAQVAVSLNSPQHDTLCTRACLPRRIIDCIGGRDRDAGKSCAALADRGFDPGRSLRRPPDDRNETCWVRHAVAFNRPRCVRSTHAATPPNCEYSQGPSAERDRRPHLQLRVHVLARTASRPRCSKSPTAAEDSCRGPIRPQTERRRGVPRHASGFDPAVHLKWIRRSCEFVRTVGTWRRRIGR